METVETLPTQGRRDALPYLKAFSPKFKGEIWENARRFRLVGAGYKSMPPEQDGFFDIRTANHCRGPLKALNDPGVRIVFMDKATQTFGSICGDIWIPYLVEHESDSILCLFEDDPKAKLYASTRCMDTVKQHPTISAMISEVIQEDGQGRHQIKNTEIKFAGSRLLRIGGLNDGNVSSLSWRFIWISEAWQHKSDGLLKKAIRRADRFEDNCKIFIESQAGPAGEDFAREASGAHQVPLTWACPFCGGRQTWECPHEYETPRPVDFVPIKPRQIAGAQLELWQPPQPGTSAGMKIPPADDGNGTILSLEQRARLAKWECYHCGTLIDDTPELRMKISDSYDQDYTLPPARPGLPRRTPRQVCFILPREANIKNSFESGALSYLKAKEAQASGNEIPLQDWYMSERAVFYSPKLTQTRVAVIVDTVHTDKDGHIPNESFRSLQVDCQKDLVESLRQGKDLTGNFWVIAEAHDKAGGTFGLYRGWVTSWEELFGTVTVTDKGERIIKGGLKNKLKIPTRNVAIDGGNWFDIVKEKAAHYRTKETALDGSGREVWATWKIMVGDDGRGERWDDGVWRSYWRPKTYMVDTLEPDGKTWTKIAVQVTRWSNFAVKSILYKLRMGAPGQPKFVALPADAVDAKTAAKEKGDFTYENQMNGFALGEDAKGKPKFIELHKQQHYPDDHCMGIVLKMMKGLVRGETAVGDGMGQEADKK
jgi:hypothetical protein